MILIVFQLFSDSAAAEGAADVEAGELWGVNMGTTSKSIAVGTFLAVQCTKARADKLYKFSRFYRTFEVPIDPADPTQAAFYAMGKMS